MKTTLFPCRFGQLVKAAFDGGSEKLEVAPERSAQDRCGRVFETPHAAARPRRGHHRRHSAGSIAGSGELVICGGGTAVRSNPRPYPVSAKKGSLPFGGTVLPTTVHANRAHDRDCGRRACGLQFGLRPYKSIVEVRSRWFPFKRSCKRTLTLWTAIEGGHRIATGKKIVAANHGR